MDHRSLPIAHSSRQSLASRTNGRVGYLERVFHATEEENKRAILGMLPQRIGGTMLDLGTHEGEFTVRVAQRLGVSKVLGVELIPAHAEIRRALAPRGLALISTNNFSGWHNVLSLALGYQPTPAHVSDEVVLGNPLDPLAGRPHVDLGRTHLRIFTRRALRELCAHHGLETVCIRTVGWYPLPPSMGRVMARIDPLHGAFLIGLFRRAD